MSRGRGPSYDASRITRLVTPNMRQAPPIREQARALNIAPATRRILDRISDRREREQGRVERQNDRVWDLFEREARRPIGEADEERPTSAPCTSVAETTRQWEALQRFRMFTELEADPLTRRFACAHIRRLLDENVQLLRRVALQGDVCPDPRPRTVELSGRTFELHALPSKSDVVAAIITEEAARAALGTARSGSYVSAGPRSTMTDAEARNLAALRLRVGMGLEPVPNGVLCFRPDITRVLERLSAEGTTR
jgi:hypothetical protein